MAYLDLTTNEQILAVLTIDETSLDDTMLAGYGLEDDLLIALEGTLPTWKQVMVEGSKVNQARLRSFAKYFCAGTVAVSAQVFVLKKDTDGNNEGQRSDKDGWAFLSDKLLARAQTFLDDLLADLELEPAAPVLSFVSVASPARDVITQPRS